MRGIGRDSKMVGTMWGEGKGRKRQKGKDREGIRLTLHYQKLLHKGKIESQWWTVYMILEMLLAWIKMRKKKER